MKETIDNIKKWVYERDLHKQDPRVELCKTVEEVGELSEAILKGWDNEGKDAIGDIVVTLICLCEQKGWNFEHCLNAAYEEIKDRKGKIINGTFVKEDDIR